MARNRFGDPRRIASAVGRLPPPALGGVAAAGALAFTMLRLAAVGGGPGAFVVAGDRWVDPASVPGDVPVSHGDGFDGQFFYRLTLDPFELSMHEHLGITFDVAYRAGRIGYPLLSWVVSAGGAASLAAVAMIAVNVVAIGALGWIGAQLAADRGRAPIWGLAIATYWGFGIALGRNLSELVAAACVFAAFVCLERADYRKAGLVLVVAVLTREQAVLTVAALAIGVLVEVRRQGAVRRGAASLTWLVVPPALAFLSWQLWAARQVGELPATAGSRLNSTWPFLDLVPSFRRWVDEFGEGLGASLALICFAGLVCLVGLAVASGGLGVVWATRPWELLVGVSALVVLVSSTSFVLAVPADFRQHYELAGVSWMVLWVAPGQWRYRALAVAGPVTLLTLAFRCLVL